VALHTPTLDATIELIRQCFGGSLDGVLLTDDQRRVIYCNDALRDLCDDTHRKREVAQLPGCAELLGMEMCRHNCLAARAAALGAPLRVHDVAGRRADGEELLLIVTAAPISGVGVLETFRDVTAEQRIHKRYKAMLKEAQLHRQALEWAVQERTAELKSAQSQLVHSEKMSSLGSLVAGIAHEINNPINFVRTNVSFLEEYFGALEGMIQILRDNVKADKKSRQIVEQAWERHEIDYVRKDLKDLLRAIKTGAERTATIVNDLKTFSRMGEGTFQDADLREGIEMTIALCHPLLRDRITVRKEFGPPFKVRCNVGHINQVFMNLLTNAAQAIVGAGEISISLRQEDDWGVFELRDTGPGIADEIKGKIFDPFFTTKPVGQGTGLGLSVSYGIVKDHGGTLEVDNGPERGAVARVRLPLNHERGALERVTLRKDPTSEVDPAAANPTAANPDPHKD
jgi:signal transduction histidine kinase